MRNGFRHGPGIHDHGSGASSCSAIRHAAKPKRNRLATHGLGKLGAQDNFRMADRLELGD
jgi:hypothetical protein